MISRSIRNRLQWLRWRARRGQVWLRRRHLGGPVLFANSFPKSGTHLLTQVLAGFTRLGPVVPSGLPAVTMYDGFTGLARPMAQVIHETSRYLPGDIGYGHLHAEPEIINLLCREGVAPFFIYRDPRDVVVSHVHYITEIETDHIHHDYYANQLGSFEERLTASILGRPDLADIPFPGIAARFAPFLPWLSRPEVLNLQFEAFIQDKHAVLGKIFDHAVNRGFEHRGDREAAVAALAAAIDPHKSPTFRSGKAGGWKERFLPEHKAMFKEQAGTMLIQLGYEKDMEW